VLVEVTPEALKMAAPLYGRPEAGADELASYTDEQLELLAAFMRGSIAIEEERIRRLDAVRARDARKSGSAPAAARRERTPRPTPGSASRVQRR
jgi:hypothetical protein